MKRTHKIYKGFHYPVRLIPEFLRYIGYTKYGKDYMHCRTIKFNDDCCYHIDGEDQWDWSKLYGVFFGIRGIHRDSVRFGWRYNPNTQKIEICRIMYYGDNPIKHTMKYLMSINPGEIHDYCIIYKLTDNDMMDVEFYIDEHCWNVTVPKPRRKMHYGTGFYFGGNQCAPQSVSIEIS